MPIDQANLTVGERVSAAEKKAAPPALAKLETWQTLVKHSLELSRPQIDAFSARLSHALFAKSEQANDAKEANWCFHGAQLLKNSTYTYYYLSSHALEKALMDELHTLGSSNASEKKPVASLEIEMSLVSYEEMDLKLSFGRASRALELAHAESLAALNMRLGSLLGQETLNLSQNPFRPEVFIRAFHSAWCEFNPEKGAHALVLPLLSELIFDLAPIYHSLNELLVIRGILPDLQETYRKKRKASVAGMRATEGAQNEMSRKLEQYFAGQNAANQDSGGDFAATANYASGDPGASEGMSLPPMSSEVFQYLAELQKSMAIHQLVSGAQNAMRLSQIRQEMPTMFRSGVERHTLDLLSHVFDGVMGNQAIATPIKDLISGLQVPVLKAALIDKNFFFQDSHPARRLIELLSKYSADLDPEKGEDDPLFQAMQRNVLRVQKEFDHQLSLFDEVVSDLENFVRKDEAATIEALQVPINRALQKEKFRQASIAAKHEVSLRIGTGEVLAFVETFLENRWTKVLTLAYSVKDEKPHALEDALKTMDDLIWSIKPKITLAQRQEMINRLPGILARLNKWLSLIKWEDADRVQFFADLAECHASIVRAPLELSPERQVEIAVEAAKLATERRLEKRAKAMEEERAKAEAEEAEKARLIAQAVAEAKAAEQANTLAPTPPTHAANAATAATASTASPAIIDTQIQTATEVTTATTAEVTTSVIAQPAEPASAPSSELAAVKGALASQDEAAPGVLVDEVQLVAAVTEQIESAADRVAALERGEWVEFIKRDRSVQKVRLAWVSPMRSLFIFTSSQKEKSFSIAAEELEKNFKEGKAKTIVLDKVVDRALAQALNEKTQLAEASMTVG